MKFYNEAEQAANTILAAFQSPETLPAALAPIFIQRNDDTPCRRWSWSNQLLTALAGHSDARGFRQWEEVGRKVMKGQKAFRILSPCTRTIEDKATGEKKTIVSGFKGTPVFGLSQTEGEPLPEPDPELAGFLQSLPFRSVAESWNLTIEAYSGEGAGFLGYYRHKTAIAIGVKNLSTFCHELMHAADDRCKGGLKGGQHCDQEVVAQLGAAILLKIMGDDTAADLGFTWKYIQAYATKANVDTIAVCQSLLTRTCEAVAMILDTAEAIAKESAAVAQNVSQEVCLPC